MTTTNVSIYKPDMNMLLIVAEWIGPVALKALKIFSTKMCFRNYEQKPVTRQIMENTGIIVCHPTLSSNQIFTFRRADYDYALEPPLIDTTTQ